MMGRVVCLIITLIFLNTFVILCVGNVLEIFNHPEESPSAKHADLREDIEKSSYYPSDDQIIDDLYTSLDMDDYKNGLYAYNKPDFKTRLIDALSRIKYVDGSLKGRRQTNEDQFKTYERFKQTPYGDVEHYVADDGYNSKEKLLKRNLVDSVTYMPRNGFENLLYDEFYKSPNNNPLLAKFPQNDQTEVQRNSASLRARNGSRIKIADVQNNMDSVIKNEVDINKSIALLTSLLKTDETKDGDKLKYGHYPKDISEYDVKYKRDLPDMYSPNNTDSDNNEENNKRLKERDCKIRDAINDISEKINENAIVLRHNKRYLLAMTEAEDINTEANFVDNNKENSEIMNDEKEIGSGKDETASDDIDFHDDDKISDVESPVDELTEEKEIAENEPEDNVNRNSLKLKQSHRDKNAGRSNIRKETEKFRIRRRDDEQKSTENTTDNLNYKTTEIRYNGNYSINSGNVTNNNGTFYNNNTSLVNNVDSNGSNITVNQVVGNVQQDQILNDKATMVLSNPVNAVLPQLQLQQQLSPMQQLSQVATPPTVHNVTENLNATVLAAATKTWKGRVGAELPNTAGNVYDNRPVAEMVTNSCQRNSTDKCLAFNTSRKPNITDELKIAKQINDYVRNLLVHASKTSMRKELGLCKTYDKEYSSVKTNRNDMEDEIMKGMINCLSKILSGSIKPTPCGEMPPELLQFLDWLLLNGVSARDEFKQFMVNGGPQRKSFLFAKNDNNSSCPSTSRCDAATEKQTPQCASRGLAIENNPPRNDSANASNSSLYSNLKKTILSGLSPYLKYGTENQDINRMYPFSNNHVISNRNVKIPPRYGNRDRPNGYNRFFSPLLDPELYRMYPYYRPSKERWSKTNKYADEMLNENPYEDMYLPRSKLNYPHLFNLYPKLPQDQSPGVVGDGDLTQFDNPLARKEAADFDGLG